MTYHQYIITWSNGESEIFYDPEGLVTLKTTFLYDNDCNLVDVNLKHARKIVKRYRYKYENQWVCQDA